MPWKRKTRMEITTKRRMAIVLFTIILTLLLSSCAIFKGDDDVSDANEEGNTQPPATTVPAPETSAPTQSSAPAETNPPTAVIGTPDENSVIYVDVVEYIGMVDSNCIEVKTCSSEDFMTIRLTEEAKDLLDSLDIDTGDLITVNYSSDGYDTYTIYGISTEYLGNNPGFFNGTYEFRGRIDNSSIEVNKPGEEGFEVFRLTEEIKSLFDGFDFDPGDSIDIRFVKNENEDNVIYMISETTGS